MKQFLHSLLGTLAGLAVFSIVAVVLGFGVLGAIIAVGSGGDAPTIERGSYLVFDLSSTVTDAPDSGIAAALELADGDSLQLRQLTAALRAAADDERIAGVLLRGELLALSGASGFASLREVRLALEDFRASGKPVKAYLTSASTSDYYLASVADEIVLDPYGMILMPGLASEPVFLAGAFERFGVGVQVTRVGRYKSAIEPFTRSDMSPENREELQKLLDDIWASLLADIAQRRGVSVADIQGVVDAEGILRADAALEARLVDRVAYVDEVIADLRQETGRARGPRNTFRQMDFLSYAEMVVDEDQPSSGDAIGVVYAEGNIVDGEGDLGQVGGARFARNLRAMRQDSSIKAIVLRVNSPGGSATASEAIQREVRLTRMSKPVVVSMGSYAASGGYWISAYGNWIFAEPTTITGSIGVFGLQFDIQQLANNIGVTFDSVKTGRFADTLTISRPKTDEEIAIFQRLVDWIYEEFVAKVADARNLTPAQVEEIAQGRVWSGDEASRIGLVDEIGGLDAAIAHAAELAELGDDYRIAEYPRKLGLSEMLSRIIEGERPSIGSSTGPADRFLGLLGREFRSLAAFNDPRNVYARLPMNLNLR